MFSVTLVLWLFGIHLEHISHGQLATQGGTEGDSSPWPNAFLYFWSSGSDTIALDLSDNFPRDRIIVNYASTEVKSKTARSCNPRGRFGLGQILSMCGHYWREQTISYFFSSTVFYRHLRPIVHTTTSRCWQKLSEDLTAKSYWVLTTILTELTDNLGVSTEIVKVQLRLSPLLPVKFGSKGPFNNSAETEILPLWVLVQL